MGKKLLPHFFLQIHKQQHKSEKFTYTYQIKKICGNKYIKRRKNKFFKTDQREQKKTRQEIQREQPHLSFPFFPLPDFFFDAADGVGHCPSSPEESWFFFFFFLPPSSSSSSAAFRSSSSAAFRMLLSQSWKGPQ